VAVGTGQALEIGRKGDADVVLVHGDTTTSTSAALAAFYQKIAVGHVEAGLRTDTIYEPFPEEMNRRITGIIATHHFAPTPQARTNLVREGKPADSIFVTGNTVIDAFLWVQERLRPQDTPAIATPHLIFAEAHRRESLGAPLESICRALRTVINAHENVTVMWPVHPNPVIMTTVRHILGDTPRALLVPPLSYRALIGALSRSTIVATDSGGLQEEAPCLGKPVLVLRRVTERPEGVAAGTLRLVGTDEGAIAAALTQLLENKIVYDSMARAVNPYGDGRAARRIADGLHAHYRGGRKPADFIPPKTGGTFTLVS